MKRVIKVYKEGEYLYRLQEYKKDTFVHIGITFLLLFALLFLELFYELTILFIFKLLFVIIVFTLFRAFSKKKWITTNDFDTEKGALDKLNGVKYEEVIQVKE